MKRKYWIFAVICVAAFLLAGGGWFLLRTERDVSEEPAAPAHLVRATNAEIVMMERQAAQACRCARRRHERPEQSACYAGFRQSLARYEHDEWSSACMPLSQTIECFGPGIEHGRCITRDWGGDACSVEEARILEAIDADSETHPNGAQERWDAAVHSFIRGEPVRPPRHVGGGCSG